MYHSVKIKEKTNKLLNDARVRFLNENPAKRPTDDNVLKDAIKNYLKGGKK